MFPDVVKAAFIFGGKVVGRNQPAHAKGWTAPAFFNISGKLWRADWRSKTDYVLLIMNEAGLNGLLKDKFEVGGGGCGGPVGREAAAPPISD